MPHFCITDITDIILQLIITDLRVIRISDITDIIMVREVRNPHPMPHPHLMQHPNQMPMPQPGITGITDITDMVSDITDITDILIMDMDMDITGEEDKKIRNFLETFFFLNGNTHKKNQAIWTSS